MSAESGPAAGRSWCDVLERGRGDASTAEWLEAQARVLVTVCDAVERAHADGLLHLDLKPADVVLTERGEVFVLGWERATPLEAGTSLAVPRALDLELERDARYMAPELAAGAALRVGVAADVYSLGAMLHELVSQTPRLKQHATREEQLAAALRNAPARYGASSGALAEVCELALETDEAARYGSAAELARAIERALSRRDSLELTEAARARLVVFFARLAQARANDPASAVSVYIAFGECRAMLAEALRQWPENPGARRAVEELLERLVEFELSAGHARGALRLLAEMREQFPAIAATTERLEGAVKAPDAGDDATRGAVAEKSGGSLGVGNSGAGARPHAETRPLADSAIESRPELELRHWRVRSGAFLIFGLGFFALHLWLGARWRAGLLVRAHEAIIAGYVGYGVLLVALGNIRPGRRLRTRADRAFLATLWSAFVSGMCLWVGALVAGSPFAWAMAVQLLLAATIATAGAFAHDQPALAFGGAPYLVGFGVLMFAPRFAWEVLAVSVLLGEVVKLAAGRKALRGRERAALAATAPPT